MDTPVPRCPICGSPVYGYEFQPGPSARLMLCAHEVTGAQLDAMMAAYEAYWDSPE